MSQAPKYGQAFALWRCASNKSWRAYTRHEFVNSLCDGTLPKAAFIQYLVQDYIFLVHFSRAWALAIVKSANLEEMKICAETVNALIHHEMQLHVETCADAGISEGNLLNAQEAPENLAYTRYVLEAGYTGDFLDLLAALAPCVLGYGEIGVQSKARQTSNEYDGWIATYSDPEYQQTCVDVGQLIDKALILRLGEDYTKIPRWSGLCKTFETATQLEAKFWDMGLRTE